MKRRGFLGLLGLVPAAPVVAKELLRERETERNYDDYDDGDYYDGDWTPRDPPPPDKDWQPSGYEMSLLDADGNELKFPSYKRAAIMFAPAEAAGIPLRATFNQACEFWGSIQTCKFHKIGATELPILDGHIFKWYMPVGVSAGVSVRAEMHLSH